jgi:hypothetical protein
LEFGAGIARYLGHALGLADQSEWPDTAQGNAVRLLTADIAEHFKVCAAAGDAHMWSAASGLERLIFERLELLMGCIASEKYSRSYLDSVLKPLNERGTGPRKRARAEDAPLETFFKQFEIDAEQADEWRQGHLFLKDLKSELFVHPTAVGPMLTRGTSDGSIDEAPLYAELIMYGATASSFVVMAGHKLKCAVPVELIRGLDGAWQATKALDAFDFPQTREIYETIARRATPAETLAESKD